MTPYTETKAEEVYLRVGKIQVKTILTYVNNRIEIKTKYCPPITDEIKISMEGYKYHGFDEVNPRKIWSVPDTLRNRFVLDYMKGKNPYARYDCPLIDATPRRQVCLKHQIEMFQHWLTRRQCQLACEMGTGKSLVAIEGFEYIKALTKCADTDLWYVGPKSGVKAVTLELVKWESTIRPRMLTYEQLVKLLSSDDAESIKPPKAVVFDESSKIKTPSAKRTKAAQHLCDCMRKEYGDDAYIVLMSGTPAPKAPTDWWSQAEVACPGFLREGNIHNLKKTLCLIEEHDSITGGKYPHLVTWFDDSDKCKVCGQRREHTNHLTHPFDINNVFDQKIAAATVDPNVHDFTSSVNEVSRLYKRLQGLVYIKFKKDCLDLPEKTYEIVRVTPTVDVLRAGKLIKQTASRAIDALTLLRELSDGFQYTEEVVGKKPCPNCFGKGSTKRYECVGEELAPWESAPHDVESGDFEEYEGECLYCKGTCEVNVYQRATASVSSPKDQVFIDLLEDHDEIGRFIVWGGFTGTIDRLVAIAHTQGWCTLRVDGRGYHATDKDGVTLDADELLVAMDASHPRRKELDESYPRICFVGHPKAGGMALTLTGSPTELFFSNCFDGEARMQAEDRFHRAGMDTNRGAKIIDIIHLPTDELVLNNLKQKKQLQNLTLGEINI